MSKFRYSGKDKAFAKKMGFDDGGAIGGGSFGFSGGEGANDTSPQAQMADFQATHKGSHMHGPSKESPILPESQCGDPESGAKLCQ